MLSKKNNKQQKKSRNLLCTNKNQQINKTENLNPKVLPFWYHYNVKSLFCVSTITNQQFIIMGWDAIRKYKKN